MSKVISRAVTLNLFGEIEIWDSVDDYLDGMPSSRVVTADQDGYDVMFSSLSDVDVGSPKCDDCVVKSCHKLEVSYS